MYGLMDLAMSLFDELPLAMTIGPEPAPARMVAHLRTAIEVAKAKGLNLPMQGG